MDLFADAVLVVELIGRQPHKCSQSTGMFFGCLENEMDLIVQDWYKCGVVVPTIRAVGTGKVLVEHLTDVSQLWGGGNALLVQATARVGTEASGCFGFLSTKLTGLNEESCAVFGTKMGGGFGGVSIAVAAEARRGIVHFNVVSFHAPFLTF